MRIYYGWYIVVIAVCCLGLANGLTFQAVGLFVKPVSQEFNLSRANMNTAIVMLNFGSAAFAPFIGRLLDRYSPKRIVAISGVLLGGGLVLLGLSHSLWLNMFVLAVPLAIAVTGTSNLTSFTLVTRWFTANRGRAMALTAIGLALGGVVIAPILGLMIGSVGWRQTLIVSGVVVTVLVLALVAFIRDKPGPNDIEPANPKFTPSPESITNDAVRLTAKDILKSPVFWMIAVSMSMATGSLTAVGITIVPLGLERGLSSAQAASLISIYSGAAIVGKLVLAWFADRFDRALMLATLFAGMVLGCAAAIYSDSYLSIGGCAALFGVLTGVLVPTGNALVADRFGRASFGTTLGLKSPVSAIVGAILVRLAGEIFDRTGGYTLLFASFIVLMVVAVVLIFPLRTRTRAIKIGGPEFARDGTPPA